jgi:hypothetical protein
MKTIELDERLLAEVEEVAAQTGQTATAVIEDAVRESFARRGKTPEPRPVQFPTDTGRGVQPGVNLDSNAELLDFMEQGDVAR